MQSRRFSKLIPWLFAAPALIALTLFFVYPTIVTIFLSFTRGTITTPAKEFVGFENYRILSTEDRFFLSFEDGVFSGALVNSFAWLIVFPTAIVLIGLLVAVLADKVKCEAIIKSIMFMPMAISATAAAVIFRLLYNQNPNLGSLNAVLTSIFPEFEPIAFLGSVDLANLAVIFAGVWISTGLSVVVLSAAYKAIPAEIHEAGRIDGANAWRLFWRVSLPMLSGPVTFIAITMFINTLKMIDLVLVMTKGAPRGATRIIGNLVFGHTRSGIYTNMTGMIEVFDNVVTDNGHHGIAITEMSHADVFGNVVVDNALTGIQLLDMSIAHICDNIVADTRGSSEAPQIRQGNGIIVDYHSEATLSGNTIQGSAQHGISILFDSIVFLGDNTIADSAAESVFVDDSETLEGSGCASDE